MYSYYTDLSQSEKGLTHINKNYTTLSIKKEQSKVGCSFGKNQELLVL